MVKLCSIKGCKKKVHGHGYCNSHYHKNRTYGNPLHIVEPKKRGSPSEETRKKIGESNKITAKRFWKSLTKEEKAKRIKKPGFFKKGQTPWVKGKKATSETRKKQSHSALLRFQTQKHPHQGTHRSEKTKQLLREARIRQKPPKKPTIISSEKHLPNFKDSLIEDESSHNIALFFLSSIKQVIIGHIAANTDNNLNNV